MIRHTKRIVLAMASLLLCHTAIAQQPDRGTLLISTEALEGTMFEETVMLVVHHDDDGSIGIMINRPTNLEPAQIFPEIAGAESYTGVVYFGGPLSPARPFLLSRRTEVLEGISVRITDDVYLSADASVLGNLDDSQMNSSFTRVYAGNAQWGPGQLVSEIQSGAWEVSLARVSHVFNAAPENLWEFLLNAPRGTDVAAVRSESMSEHRLAAR